MRPAQRLPARRLPAAAGTASAGTASAGAAGHGVCVSRRGISRRGISRHGVSRRGISRRGAVRHGVCREVSLGGVQAALLGGALLPPPAPGARRLARCHRARTRRAADAQEPAVVQHVVGHLVDAQVVPYLLVAPVGQRVGLDGGVGGVPLQRRGIGALRALRPAQAGDPGVGAGQRPAQRLHLAHLAAALAPGHTGVEQVGAFAAHHLLHRRRIGKQHFVAHAVAAHRARHQVVGLLVQAPGIEHENARPRFDGQQHVGQHLVLGAQRGGQRDAPVIALQQGSQQRLGTAFGNRRQFGDSDGRNNHIRHIRHI